MKILIDINHPAHVHYFKGFIKIMQDKGYEIIVINRNSKMINELLNLYHIDHIIRHKRPLKNNAFRSLWYLCRIILFIMGQSLKKKPDVYLGFASTACAINSFIFRKKSILFDDTEHNHLNHILYKPFCSTLFTPFYFEKEMGKKQNRFNAYMEQLYLHSDYFKNDTQVLSDLGLIQYNYVLVRYIAYDARHDRNVVPFPVEVKKQIVRHLSRRMKVIVSCENDAYDDFYEQYRAPISPDKMHYLIANAKLLISEGATMSCEAGLLGTPYLYINPLKVGYINLQTNKYIYAKQCTEESEIFSIIDKSLSLQWEEKERIQIRKEIESQTINPTEMLIDYIENLNK
jgi:predicted glycosyltransferase